MNTKAWTLVCLVLLLAGLPSCGSSEGKDDAAPVLDTASAEGDTPLITRLSEQLLANPDDATLYFRRGVAFRAYNNKAALADFKRAWQIDSSSPDHALGLAEQYFNMNESRAALGVLSRWLNHNVPDRDVLWSFANMAMVVRQYEPAIGALNRLLQMDRFDAEVYYLKGRNQRLLGDSAAAISSYQTAIEIDPDLERAHLELGVMLASNGQESGLRYLDNVLELNDSNRIARYQMAKYQQDFGDMTLAVEAYEDLIRRDPQDGDALYNLGTIWYGADSLEKALRLFDLTTKVEPARAMAYYAKGLVASELGRNEEALRYLRQAINLQPDLEPALDLLASLSVSQP